MGDRKYFSSEDWTGIWNLEHYFAFIVYSYSVNHFGSICEKHVPSHGILQVLIVICFCTCWAGFWFWVVMIIQCLYLYPWSTKELRGSSCLMDLKINVDVWSTALMPWLIVKLFLAHLVHRGVNFLLRIRVGYGKCWANLRLDLI